MRRAAQRALARGLVLGAALCIACTPPPIAPDGGVEDAGADSASEVDAGCTAVPGDLTGERTIAAGALLPDLTLDTPDGPTSLGALHAPCEQRVIVIRSMASWSGPSQWHAGHTASLLADGRIDVVDLLTEDEDAAPATLAAGTRWTSRYDVAPTLLAVDPLDRFATIAFGGIRLPLVAIVDARDLRVVRVLFAPHAGDVEHAALVALAEIDGVAPPGREEPLRVDERFPEDAWDLITAMQWAPPPPDLSNAVADDAEAAGVGATFFEDAGLSPEGVGCATCHDPGRAFTDGLAVGQGVAEVRRNTPALFGASHERWLFWDGRADSLWAQALGPIESPLEMASSRLYVAHRVFTVHRRSYEAIFGAMPPLDEVASGEPRFPPEGGPGDAAYDAMSEADRDAVTRVLVNVAKAIAAYERTLSPPETAFDRYVAGDHEALTPLQRDGLLRFVENGCIQCHHGPTLSDGAFHAIDMPGHELGDRGRIDVLPELAASPFRRHGPYSDDASAFDPLGGVSSFDAQSRGAFRTPSLRGLPDTAPYGHGGTFTTLREIVEHYATARAMPPTDPRVEGMLDPHVPGFESTSAQIDTITALLSAL